MSSFIPMIENCETDEIKLAVIRNYRNLLLSQSDWTQLADAQCDKTAWAQYRQSLRDLPATINLANPIIPDTPSE
jgi:hypothetical protein